MGKVQALSVELAAMKYQVLRLQGESDDAAFVEAVKIVGGEVDVLGRHIFGQQQWQAWQDQQSLATEAPHTEQEQVFSCSGCGEILDGMTGGSYGLRLPDEDSSEGGYWFMIDIALCHKSQSCIEKAWERAKTASISINDAMT